MPSDITAKVVYIKRKRSAKDGILDGININSQVKKLIEKRRLGHRDRKIYLLIYSDANQLINLPFNIYLLPNYM